MRSRLREANPTDDFVRRVDQKRYEQLRTLLLVAHVNGLPERLNKIVMAFDYESLVLSGSDVPDLRLSGECEAAKHYDDTERYDKLSP